MRALVVGCGLTGCAIARVLKERVKDVDVTIWEKSRGVGGRMTTARCPAGRPGCTADVGAQYISATPAYLDKHARYYDELLTTGVLTPMTAVIEGERNSVAGTKHFVAPKGISSVVKFFLEKAGDVDVKFGHRLLKLEMSGTKWEAETELGVKGSFDAVVLTMPTPQILQLTGSVAGLLRESAEAYSALTSSRYSSRYAMAIFLPTGTELAVQWDAKYFPQDPCICFVSVDNRKRGQVGDQSIVLHTSGPFGVAHLEDSLEVVQAVILDHAQRLLPWLPSPTSEGFHVKCHRWRYSQVLETANRNTQEPAGFVSIGAIGKPPLVCAGDAFVHSNFDGCLTSAEAASEWLVSQLQQTASY